MRCSINQCGCKEELCKGKITFNASPLENTFLCSNSTAFDIAKGALRAQLDLKLFFFIHFHFIPFPSPKRAISGSCSST